MLDQLGLFGGLIGLIGAELAGRVCWAFVLSWLFVPSCVDRLYDAELTERAGLAFWC